MIKEISEIALSALNLFINANIILWLIFWTLKWLAAYRNKEQIKINPPKISIPFLEKLKSKKEKEKRNQERDSLG